MTAEDEPNRERGVEPAGQDKYRAGVQRSQGRGIARQKADAVDVHGAESGDGAHARIVTSRTAAADDRDGIGFTDFLTRPVETRGAIDGATHDVRNPAVAFDGS